MNLIFSRPYLSIDAMRSIALPQFSIVTGVNGSGKSHLLEAIQARHVLVEGLGNEAIVLFNNETFRLESEEEFSSQNLSDDRRRVWNYYNENLKNLAREWTDVLGSKYIEIKSYCRENGVSLWDAPFREVEEYRRRVTEHLSGSSRHAAFAASIFQIAHRVPYALSDLTHTDFEAMHRPIVSKQELLPAQLGKMFWSYYIKANRNQVYQYQNQTKGTNFPCLSDAAFEQAHGPAPWTVVNEILASFESLRYRVTSPEGKDPFGNFQLKLTHVDRPSLEVEFGRLSSGERVLLALVAVVYRNTSNGRFPRVLLLDEVDASLHPSMVKKLLEVIRSVFLQRGVEVILVTHSPSTVALAPEDSVFVMKGSGEERLVKTSRVDALEILTQGFATLEHGLKLFDQLSGARLTIVSEGHNAAILEKLVKVFGLSDVAVLRGVEDVSGDSHLRTLFQFFCKMQHSGKVLVVWDCHYKKDINSANDTFGFVIPYNPENSLAKSGIENAFPESALKGFIKTIAPSNKPARHFFDDERKKDFAESIARTGTRDDFAHFAPLVDEIERILAQ